MDFKVLERLMIKYGTVIRAVPEKISFTVEKRHINEYPEGKIEFLPEYGREMLVGYKNHKYGGKLALGFAKHTANDLPFMKWQFFDSLEDIINYLVSMEK